MAIDKREAVLSVLKEGRQEYIPAAFFLHFPSEFHRGEAAVRKHEEFFRATGMDFVKVQLELPFPQVEMSSPSDWTSTPRLGREFFADQLEVVRGLVDRLGHEALVVLTLYSPFMIAAHISGRETLDRHLEEDRAAVVPAIQNLTEDLLAFVRDCANAGLDGFYHSTQGGESGRFRDRSLFEQAVKPFDLTVMRECERLCRFNILHICDYHRHDYGGYDDLSRFVDYPGHVVNCATEGRLSQEISALFGRPFMGGMERLGPLAGGSAHEAREAARAAIAERSERFILAADCTVAGDTPWENLRAAIDEAHDST